MPLRIQPTIRDKEHISSFNNHPLSSDLIQTFRSRFEIPEAIPVDGILFDSLFLYPEIRDKGLVPLLKSARIDPFEERGPINPHEFNSPQLLESGKLSVAMKEGDLRYHFQAVLRFDARPHLPIRYQTHRQHTDTLMMVLSSTSVLGVLPFEFLQKIT